METRENKTMLMLLHKIEWSQIEEELNITRPTLTAWRKSGEKEKNEVIDYAVSSIVERIEVKK